jgi:hypothetical protein
MSLIKKLPDVIWCVDCGARFPSKDVNGAPGCPKCGSFGVPCSGEQDVSVDVNWHELRILIIWAENFATRIAANSLEGKKMAATVTAIARRLYAQHPTFPPLTLSAEIAALPTDLQKAGIQVGKIETFNVPKVQPVVVNGPGAVGHVKKPAPDPGG